MKLANVQQTKENNEVSETMSTVRRCGYTRRLFRKGTYHIAAVGIDGDRPRLEKTYTQRLYTRSLITTIHYSSK